MNCYISIKLLVKTALNVLDTVLLINKLTQTSQTISITLNKYFKSYYAIVKMYYDIISIESLRYIPSKKRLTVDYILKFCSKLKNNTFLLLQCNL